LSSICIQYIYFANIKIYALKNTPWVVKRQEDIVYSSTYPLTLQSEGTITIIFLPQYFQLRHVLHSPHINTIRLVWWTFNDLMVVKASLFVRHHFSFDITLLVTTMLNIFLIHMINIYFICPLVTCDLYYAIW